MIEDHALVTLQFITKNGVGTSTTVTALSSSKVSKSMMAGQWSAALALYIQNYSSLRKPKPVIMLLMYGWKNDLRGARRKKTMTAIVKIMIPGYTKDHIQYP